MNDTERHHNNNNNNNDFQEFVGQSTLALIETLAATD